MIPDRYFFARLSCMLAIIASLMGSTAPSPLYGAYITRFQMNDVTVMAIFTLYAVGILASLTLSPLLDRHIRNQRYVLVPGLIVTAAGLLVFALAENVAMLFAGRILNGAGAGMITGIASVRLYELAPEHRRARAATVSTLAFSLGAAIGPMLTSAALALDLAPTRLPFLLITLLCALALLGVMLARWPRHVQPVGAVEIGEAGQDAQPLPDGLPLRFFVLACAGLGIGWYVASVLMGLGPHIGVTLYGLGSAGLAGMLPALFQLASGAGQIALGRVGTVRALMTGVIGMAAFLLLLILGLPGGYGPLLLGIMPVLGFFYGAAFVGALGLANQASPPERRTDYIARFYIAGHIGGVTPTMGIGVLVDRIGLEPAVYLFGASVLAVTLGAALFAVFARRARPGGAEARG
ncbi:MFS transporter [Salipiger sp. P9]|uniref:MFS transporter n=1 Tax=Salipiger pentaromativorans TaxID=2943193 RepID=UPI002157C691|nr:MFS transporter [Salipiger pentaromativorans]MCR8550541.1 MFS transporter [Salipiger pentaromativorans]